MIHPAAVLSDSRKNPRSRTDQYLYARFDAESIRFDTQSFLYSDKRTQDYHHDYSLHDIFVQSLLLLFQDHANLKLKSSLRTISNPPPLPANRPKKKPPSQFHTLHPPLLSYRSNLPPTLTPSANPNLGNRPLNHPSSNLFVALRSLSERLGPGALHTAVTSSSSSSIMTPNL